MWSWRLRALRVMVCKSFVTMKLHRLWGQCSLLRYKKHKFCKYLLLLKTQRYDVELEIFTDTRSTWKRATACCYTPKPVTLSDDNLLQLMCHGGARWGSGEPRTNILQHGSSQHFWKVLTPSCKDVSTKELSSPDSLLVEHQDNSIDITIALSWLCCDRVGSHDLWRSWPTIQWDCA